MRQLTIQHLLALATLILLAFSLTLPVMSQSLPASCAHRFIEHTLPHITATRGPRVRFYESNGSGVGINDLNNDGKLDVVLGNLNGANTILWNEGNLRFRPQSFSPTGRARSVALVDVDGDGWRDITLTTQLAAPQFWRNNQNETFTRLPLPGVNKPAYVMQWSDIDSDGDLDLATASYDSELSRELRDSFLFSGGAGVYVYENRDGTFIPTRLNDKAQALAIWLSDLDDDGQIDLFIGNDFSFPDQMWTLSPAGWKPIEPFSITAFSTMSFEVGDINNDGQREFFAADMAPYETTPEVLSIWQPVLDSLAGKPLPSNNRQVFRNVLHIRQSDQFYDQAEAYGIAATGWSWSSKLGDLDQDGYLDLYVVNGMAAMELFPQLPGSELVERNRVFRNLLGERFIPADDWNLDSPASGRGMSMADLDDDGDLDVVINNLNQSAQLFENQLCQGRSLQVELRWPGSGNQDGIGAQLMLHTSSGSYFRDVRSGSGYLSGDTSRIHFGFPAESQLFHLEVRWPDGVVSTVETVDSFLTLSR